MRWAAIDSCDLRNANLLGADLERVDFSGAHLCGADMRMQPNVTALQASKAHCWDDKTIWIEGMELRPAVRPHEIITP